MTTSYTLATTEDNQGVSRPSEFLWTPTPDTGTPLGEHVCEGRVVGDCECLEATP